MKVTKTIFLYECSNCIFNIFVDKESRIVKRKRNEIPDLIDYAHNPETGYYEVICPHRNINGEIVLLF